MIEETLKLADRSKRFLGSLIDGLLMLIITIPILILTGILRPALQGKNPTAGQQFFSMLLGLAVFLILNGYLLAKKGQTIGKVVMKTRIVDTKGQRVPLGYLLFLRYLFLNLFVFLMSLVVSAMIASLIGGIDALFIFTEDKRCLHDYIAGTVVIDA